MKRPIALILIIVLVLNMTSCTFIFDMYVRENINEFTK